MCIARATCAERTGYGIALNFKIKMSLLLMDHEKGFSNEVKYRNGTHRILRTNGTFIS